MKKWEICKIRVLNLRIKASRLKDTVKVSAAGAS